MDHPSPPTPASATAPTSSVSVVGRGRLGRPLARALRAAGATVHGPTGSAEPIIPADVVLLCIPDGVIADVAPLAAKRATLVGHTSGATSLTSVGFGLHPLQTFTGEEDPGVFHGIGCAVAGVDDRALETATRLAELLGTRPFPLRDDQRAAYHAAASIASNYLITLEECAVRVAGTAGIDSASARELLAPLVRRAVDNWAVAGAAALTGPLVRGDEATVAQQRAAVGHTPELLDLFDELTAHTRVLIGLAGPVGKESSTP